MCGPRKDKVLGKVQIDLSKYLRTDSEQFEIELISDIKGAYIRG